MRTDIASNLFFALALLAIGRWAAHLMGGIMPAFNRPINQPKFPP
jgi:hypothetical protein